MALAVAMARSPAGRRALSIARATPPVAARWRSNVRIPAGQTPEA